MLGFCALMCRLELKHTCGYSSTCAQPLYSTHIQLSLAEMHRYCPEGVLRFVSHGLWGVSYLSPAGALAHPLGTVLLTSRLVGRGVLYKITGREERKLRLFGFLFFYTPQGPREGHAEPRSANTLIHQICAPPYALGLRGRPLTQQSSPILLAMSCRLRPAIAIGHESNSQQRCASLIHFMAIFVHGSKKHHLQKNEFASERCGV